MKENTIMILRKAGWYPNRKIEITDLIKHYEEKGFEMFPAAKRFVEEYGMLDIYLPIDPKIPEEDIKRYGFNRFTFHTTNISDAIIKGFLSSRDYVREYEEYIEEKLVIVGKLIDNNAILMISESGKLFTEYGFFGNNADEFWDRLIGGDTVINWEAWEG